MLLMIDRLCCFCLQLTRLTAMRTLWNEVTSTCGYPYACPSLLFSSGTSSNGGSPSNRLNIQTYNYQHRFYGQNIGSSDVLIVNGETCRYSCAIPHLNVIRVAEFFRTHLEGLDSFQSEEYISCINCTKQEGDRNIAFFGTQLTPRRVVFGTKELDNGNHCSYAVSASVVAHEFAHKLIFETIEGEKGFNYESKQSGALEESYADIFAILFTNRNERDIRRWDWEIGNGFGANEAAIRDMQSPPRYNHPDHMSNYIDYNYNDSPCNKYNDWCGCHSNNGIHNKAIYYLLSSRNENDQYLFNVRLATQLLYLTLIELRVLTEAQFEDSRNAMYEALNFLEIDERQKRELRNAILQAFDNVGISKLTLSSSKSPF